MTELGYQPAANCYDCHGSHNILAGQQSGLARFPPTTAWRPARQCHPHATANFASFDPHVNYHDPHDNPIVYWVYRVLLTLLLTTFGFFGLHAVFWFVRGLVEVFREGRPQGLVPGQKAYVRFVPMHRRAHAVLLLSFLGLALTGLPLKYSEHEWAKALANSMGGFESTSFWHRVFALVTFTCFGIYMVRLVRQFFAGHRRGNALAAGGFRARFARAQLARREGLLQDAPLVRGLGAEAQLRALGLLGEVRFLGRLRRHRHHRFAPA